MLCIYHVISLPHRNNKMAGLARMHLLKNLRQTWTTATTFRSMIRPRSVSSTPEDSVGFVGLGNMGMPMAKNLLKAGVKLTVFDINAESVKTLQQSGASVAGSPAEIADSHKLVVTMLPAGQHVKEVYTGTNGLFSSADSGTLFIDSSTTEPQTSIDLSREAEGLGVTFMDAPVSGGVGAATAGTLTFIVGGARGGFDRAKPVLDLMGKNVVHCGESGAGQATKICNNMMLGISMIGTSEALNLGIKLGLDPKVLTSVLNISSGRSWSSDTYNPCPGVMEGVPASRDYEGGFGTGLMAKDLGLAQNAATTTKAPTPLGSLAHQLYRLLCVQGLESKDFSVVFKYLQENQK